MEQAEGFEVKWNIDKKPICILNKSLYVLKQLGRDWNKTLQDCLTRMDFIQNQAEHCLHSIEQVKNRYHFMGRRFNSRN